MPLCAVLSSQTPQPISQALQHMGCELLFLPPHPLLPPAVASHPDLLLFFAPDVIYTTSEYRKLAHDELKRLQTLTDRPIRCIDTELNTGYAYEVALDAAPIGNYLICHKKHTAQELTLHPMYQPIFVRQGYAKCATVPLGDRALITADPSISSSAEQAGLEVLSISSGQVHLSGYSTGFLGGATSYTPYRSTDRIFFCGNYKYHSDADAITDFCYAHKTEAISLCDLPLTDIGTIFLL